MSRNLYYDFHIHSCLSPCGHEDMTPNNIVNMALICGLHAIALTDHNTCQNTPAVAQAAQAAGLGFLPGMELSTAEDIHVVFLFPTVEAAMDFDGYVSTQRMPVKNKPHIFGHQLVMDACDEIVREEENLLITATAIPVDHTPDLARRFGGLCYPAHIDRNSYSILATLGCVPQEYGFPAVEVHQPETFFQNPLHGAYKRAYPILTSSDAHCLEHIAEAGPCLPASPETSPWEALRQYLGQ